MTDSAQIADKDIPQFARQCWQYFQESTQEQREREKESLGFWIGGKFQWRPGETESRQGKNRPWMTINRCKPAVDQVENEARNNPPGPQAHPVGEGADKDGADILEGLIREYEYRSHATSAYVTSLRYAAAGGSGAFELATDYVDERSMAQELVVKEIEDPSTLFYDPEAVKPCREDAMWQGKIRVLSREKLMEEYPGKALKVLNRSTVENMMAGVGGWMQDAIGLKNDFATMNTWTGAAGKGPYYVCEFWRVLISHMNLKLYSDNILRFDGETVPSGIAPKQSVDGELTFRDVPRRKVFKYIVTALDVLQKTEWYGTTIPIFWVMGPEVWRDRKLYRQSLITGAMDSQRGLNYSATTAAEITGLMSKAPFIGWEGQFDVVNAQGFNPWENTNGAVWAYLETKPVFSQDPSGLAAPVLLPPPQRNNWEAPIQRVLELATFFGEQIKAATSVFFEPATTSAQMAQSGAAIRALQQQTNVGTINWQDNLHRAVMLSYNQAAIIMPKIYDGPRVRTIVRPDNQHEVMEINREFPDSTHDFNVGTGKYTRKSDGGTEKTNNIVLGRYSLRVNAGPKFEDRQDEAVEKVTEAIKFMPTLLQNPQAAAQFLRWVGQGDPAVEQMADAIAPSPDGDTTPEQMQQQLQQANQHIKVLAGALQKMQQEAAQKLPELEQRGREKALDSVTRIRVAEIGASKDTDNAKADRDAAMLEHVLSMAHDAATQAADHEQAGQMADKTAAQEAAQPDQEAQ